MLLVSLDEEEVEEEARRHEFEIRPEELIDPKPHHLPGGHTAVMWTTVRLGVSTRIVRVNPTCPHDEAGSAELHVSMLASIASVSLSLIDTYRRHELLFTRGDVEL